jgi:hypothetical protein
MKTKIIKTFNFILKHYRAVLLILFSTIGLGLPLYYKIQPSLVSAEKINSGYSKSVKLLQSAANKILFDTDSLNSPGLFEELNNAVSSFKKYGIEAFVTENGKIIAWTTNTLPLSSEILNSGTKILTTPDGSLIRKIVRKNGQGKNLICILKIKKGYPIENDYLQNKLNPTIFGNTPYKISKTGIAIKDPEGFTAFYISQKTNTIPSNIILLSIIFLFISLLLTSIILATSQNKIIKIATGIFILILYFLSLVLHGTSGIPFLQPYIFSSNSLLPNILSVLLLALFIYYLTLFIPQNITDNRIKLSIVIVLYPIVYILFFHILKSLIIDSTVNFRIHEITSWSLNTVVMVIIFVLIILSIVRFAIRTFPYLENKFMYAAILFSIPILYILLLIFSYGNDNILAILLYFLLLALLYFHNTAKNSAKQIISLLVLAIVTTSFVIYFSNIKEKSIKELLVTKLVEERDLVAETLAKEITDRIETDTAITQFINDTTDISTINNNISEYLRKNYFAGYWTNFDIQVTCCTPDCNLEILGENRIENCYHYFSHLTSKYGTAIINGKFFFLNNNNGRISYLFVLSPHGKKDWKIFVEADSKLVSIRQGYPELMLNYGINKNNLLTEYSYAKYKNGRLYSQYGSFAYPLVSQIFDNASNMTETTLWGYEHLIYFAGNNTLFVLSNPKRGFWDFLQALSYIFIISKYCLFIY